ncbi:MAG: NAD(P)-binding protein, partial [Proteobacteria bacterium]|nr:NAD(P)-binding protein [Pseudomonadota bacterium]
QYGYSNYVIYEKSDRLGGTWRENTYPGIACDVPAHLYTYSFEPNPDWSRTFAPGAEIQAYFERIAAQYRIVERVRFNERSRVASSATVAGGYAPRSVVRMKPT